MEAFFQDELTKYVYMQPGSSFLLSFLRVFRFPVSSQVDAMCVNEDFYTRVFLDYMNVGILIILWSFLHYPQWKCTTLNYLNSIQLSTCCLQ